MYKVVYFEPCTGLPTGPSDLAVADTAEEVIRHAEQADILEPAEVDRLVIKIDCDHTRHRLRRLRILSGDNYLTHFEAIHEPRPHDAEGADFIHQSPPAIRNHLLACYRERFRDRSLFPAQFNRLRSLVGAT